MSAGGPSSPATNQTSGENPMFDRTVQQTRMSRGTTFRALASVRRFAPALLLTLAFVLPPLLVGAVGGAREWRAQQIEPPPALGQPLPDQPVHDPSKRTAVIVAGNTGTES